MPRLNSAPAAMEIAGILERRRNRRHAVGAVGLLVWPDLWAPLECNIVDMSDEGARLKTLRSVTLPTSFTLRVPEQGFAIQVRLKWRDENHIGVQFTGPPTLFLPV